MDNTDKSVPKMNLKRAKNSVAMPKFTCFFEDKIFGEERVLDLLGPPPPL